MKAYTNGKTITPIAFIKTDFNEKFGIPRQSGRVPSLYGEVVFLPKFNNIDFIKGLENFSHLWLVFDFSKVEKEPSSATVRPPRLGGNTKVGVFATRSPFRPNRLGLSSCKLEKIKYDNNQLSLIVSGIDLLNDTPIYDIKPYLPTSDCHTDAIGGFADEFSSHKLQVVCDEQLLSIVKPEKRQALLDCIAEDPRPSYQNDQRIYGFAFAGVNVKFTIKDNTATILQIEKQ